MTTARSLMTKRNTNNYPSPVFKMHIYIYIYIHTHSLTHTGVFKMIVGVLTTCHTQQT